MRNLIEKIVISIKTWQMEPEKQIAKILIDTNQVIAIAESCTGGLISSRLTDIPDSSKFIRKNFITYTNAAKAVLLNVTQKTLKEKGAVSEQVASEMARGVLKNTGADIGISITGIAGPKGVEDDNPIGRAYIAIASKDKVSVLKYTCDSRLERKIIKYKFSQSALEFLWSFLLEQEEIKKGLENAKKLETEAKVEAKNQQAETISEKEQQPKRVSRKTIKPSKPTKVVKKNKIKPTAKKQKAAKE